jgi:hypothetical protein
MGGALVVGVSAPRMLQGRVTPTRGQKEPSAECDATQIPSANNVKLRMPWLTIFTPFYTVSYLPCFYCVLLV